jgi:hypothetical protein
LADRGNRFLADAMAVAIAGWSRCDHDGGEFFLQMDHASALHLNLVALLSDFDLVPFDQAPLFFDQAPLFFKLRANICPARHSC